MLNLQLARKYSRAIFEIARDEGKLKEYGDELSNITHVFITEPELSLFMTNPQVETTAKKTVIEKAFKGELSTDVYNFIQLLTDKHRMELIPAIDDQYHALANDALGIFIADVTTALPLTADEAGKIKKKLEGVTGHEVQIRAHEDRDILGGVIVQVGDRRIDGSLRGSLRALRSELMAK